MNKLLMAGTILLATAANAYAADIYAPPPAPAPVYTKAPPAIPSWTGFYVGGIAGGAWGSFDPNTATAFSPTGYLLASSVPAVNAAGMQSIKPAGFTGGLEAGYNWQANNLVFGLEGDIDALQLRGSATSPFVVYPCCAPTGFTVSSSASANWLATARGRLGFAANNWMFYATGGAAFTTLKGSFGFVDNFSNGTTESGSLSGGRAGYTVGGGVEAALWGHWSVKAEYLYVDFGRVSTTSSNLVNNFAGVAIPFPTSVFTNSIDLKANIGRLGLNYRF
jgi:outer membrane immunogenic protein